jgi:hypothetical protein
MYFSDLSLYKYIPRTSGPNVLNVGWLDAEHQYSKQRASEELLDALFEKCSRRVNETRGFHPCPFCVSYSFGVTASRKGESLTLGSAEVWVEAKDGKIYAAPDLIYHYVAEHDYRPPQEFINALLD